MPSWETGGGGCICVSVLQGRPSVQISFYTCFAISLFGDKMVKEYHPERTQGLGEGISEGTYVLKGVKTVETNRYGTALVMELENGEMRHTFSRVLIEQITKIPEFPVKITIEKVKGPAGRRYFTLV